MRVKVISILLVLMVAISGCASMQSDNGNSSTPKETTVPDSTAQQTTSTSSQETTQKGADLLSVSKISADTASKYNESRRISFGNLSEKQTEVFTKALQCDCNVNQDVFRFNDEDRMKVVEYNDRFYYLRVSAV